MNEAVLKFLTFVAVVSALYPAMASADWQYTKWGMTQDQVLAATSGKATRLTPEEQKAKSSIDPADVEKALLQTPYSSGEYQFNAVFTFDTRSDELTSVELELANANSNSKHELFGQLRIKYGEPTSDNQSDIFWIATWYKDGDQISLTAIGDTMVKVRYQPRANENNEGL